MTREISCKIYSIHDSPPEDLGSSFPAQIHESRASLYPGFGVSERVSGRCSPGRNLRARMATSTAEGEGGGRKQGPQQERVALGTYNCWEYVEGSQNQVSLVGVPRVWGLPCSWKLPHPVTAGTLTAQSSPPFIGELNAAWP